MKSDCEPEENTSSVFFKNCEYNRNISCNTLNLKQKGRPTHGKLAQRWEVNNVMSQGK